MRARIIVYTREIGKRNFKIFGHFLEHFHRQIYGGIFDPDSHLSDSMGFRRDVIDALRRIKAPIIRWPGGCFASAYHWKYGVGDRIPVFDKAWRVEEPNTFGTDEFIEFCRRVSAEPYICANAGTGTEEEMSEWVEYCNLRDLGRWARLRRDNGHPDPYNVKFWSIGNENYGEWEVGAKEADEWARFVREAAKMMKCVDPSIKLLAPAGAATLDPLWIGKMLQKAGRYLDYISIHGYWDPLWQVNNPSPYEVCMARSTDPERMIIKTESILDALGVLGKIYIAFDEWNLRGWHHPYTGNREEDIEARNLNDDNSQYTMADAVFSAVFLNTCLRHCNSMTMACFSPTVNARGMIFTHPDGIVLRTTYHVFDLYVNHTEPVVLDSYSESESFNVGEEKVYALDAVATCSEDRKTLSLCIVNRSPNETLELELKLPWRAPKRRASLLTLCGKSPNSFNSVENPNEVIPEVRSLDDVKSASTIKISPHSVNILKISS